VGYNFDGAPVTAGNLNAAGAMAALLKEAFNPNLVQTLAGTPAIIHGGPFANIAHGCNTITATRLAMQLGDIVVTEAGFGADLGAEKFINIKCRRIGLQPAAVVLVATIRALKYHGGCEKAQLNSENLSALEKGLPNLQRHIENITKKFALPCVVAINNFPSDTPAEVDFVSRVLQGMNVPFALSEVFAKGGEGGTELAREVLSVMEKPAKMQFTYELSAPLADKIEAVAKEIYRANKVNFAPEAAAEIRKLENLGFAKLPVCIAKTQYSFSDDQKKLGAPVDFEITIKKIRLSAGAGFVVALAGDIMTMPGLPKTPAAEKIDVDDSGVISGLF
jgi:formate--tetrahydrofolate ligase